MPTTGPVLGDPDPTPDPRNDIAQVGWIFQKFFELLDDNTISLRDGKSLQGVVAGEGEFLPLAGGTLTGSVIIEETFLDSASLSLNGNDGGDVSFYKDDVYQAGLYTNAAGHVILSNAVTDALGVWPDGSIRLHDLAGSGTRMVVADTNGDLSTQEIPEGGGGSGTPGGSDTYVQYNDGGSLGGDASFTWNETTNVLTVGGRYDSKQLRLDNSGGSGRSIVLIESGGGSDISFNTSGAVEKFAITNNNAGADLTFTDNSASDALILHGDGEIEVVGNLTVGDTATINHGGGVGLYVNASGIELTSPAGSAYQHIIGPSDATLGLYIAPDVLMGEMIVWSGGLYFTDAQGTWLSIADPGLGDRVMVFDGDITVDDEAYGSGWNASLQVPTKNAVYDKMEANAISLLSNPSDFTGTDDANAQPMFGTSGFQNFVVEANTTYMVEGTVHIHTTGTTSHQLGILWGGTASIGSIGGTYQSNNSATENLGTAQNIIFSVATVINVNTATATATHHSVTIRGMIRTSGTPGTIQPQYKWSAAPGVAGVCLAQSHLMLMKVGSNTAAGFGSTS